MILYSDFIFLSPGGGADMALLQEDLIDVMPAVEEANSISEELDKKVKFEIILISPHMLGKMQGQAKADVRLVPGCARFYLVH